MHRGFLIAGANKGIGLALAHRLTAHGHTVIGIARTLTDEFPGTLYPLDTAGETAAGALADIVTHYAVDSVVNNVGLVRPQPLGTVDLAVLEEVMRLTLHPALTATHAALPGMKAGARRW
nr:SDR family NAD(P)-dependent oxidoreductase [Azospirillum canadense]